jgi:hypothetical protein
MYELLDTIDDYDKLDPSVETLVREPKDCRLTRCDQRGNSFTLVAELRVRGTNEIIHLDVRYHGRRGSKVQVILKRRNGDILRLWHHQSKRHPNPDGSLVEPLHMHFPTVDHPIREIDHRGQSTWAYTTYDVNPEDLAEVLRWFADKCNIFGLQLPANFRG